MPSSMIFVGLVVMWLLILVPAVARRRQEVARPSVTALSGRVLERTPRRDPDADRTPAAARDVEVDVRHELEPVHAVATKSESEGRSRPPGSRVETGTHGRDLDNLDGWTWRDLDDPDSDGTPDRRRPSGRDSGPARYRPGRGGYDPAAAAATARARCAFRQRVVLVLLILAVGTAVAAVFTMPQLWAAHAAVDVVLGGYLVYLRRQVRVEESIRRRRSARIAAPRPALDIENDGPRTATRSAPDGSPRRAPKVELDDAADEDGQDDDAELGPEPAGRPDDRAPVSSSIRATPGATAAAPEPAEQPPALPRRQPIPTPPVPIGTTLVEGEDDDPALHDLDSVTRPDYRRAVGQ